MIEVNYNNTSYPFYSIIDDRQELQELIAPYRYQFSWRSKGMDKDRAYLNVPCSFDIESTSYNFGTEDDPSWDGFMYVWQFALDDIAIYGRRWEEFQELLKSLVKWLDLKEYKRLPIYAHFASFEFQFIRNFINVEKVFAKKERVILTADFNNAFQLRCSYALSNMGLAKAIDSTPNAIFKKQSGDDYDYSVVRTPDTELTNEEWTYCLCDVLGLNEYLRNVMIEENMANIPMTSTGFLRRDVRKAVKKNPNNDKEIKALALSPKLYVLCKTARRGGNCHASAYYANIEVENVHSKDRKSSYPAEMEIADNYPITGFREIRATEDNLLTAVNEYASLIDLTLFDVELKAPTPIPYIAIAKCTHLEFNVEKLVDNGRLVNAKSASMVITEVDYKIIKSQYIFSGVLINSIHIAKRGHLNREFRELLLDYFRTKCKMESGDQYLYNKFKNKINAFYGMMLTDICNSLILYTPQCEDLWTKQQPDIEASLNRYYGSKNSFLSYQHGLWVVANARYSHQLGIDAVGMDCIYGDTDSVKYIENHDKDFDRLNKEWLDRVYNNDIVPVVKIGEKEFTLGKWETEKDAQSFKTLGAKKYCGIYNGKLKITVAGLSKDKGAKYLSKHGGIDAFDIDTEIPPGFSGRTASHYIDRDKPIQITVNGCTFTTGSSIAVENVSYTFGVSPDYLKYYTQLK